MIFDALLSLEAGCGTHGGEEKRLWLLRDEQPRYLLVLRRTAADRAVEGGLWRLSEMTACALHEHHGYHWAGVAAGVNSPGAIASMYRESGGRSGLTLTVERCEAGSYERTAFGPAEDLPGNVQGAATTVVGYVLRLASAAADACPAGQAHSR